MQTMRECTVNSTPEKPSLMRHIITQASSARTKP